MTRPATLQQTLPGFWQVVRAFWPYLREHRRLMAGSFAALVAEVGLRLLEPWPLKYVFDSVLRPAGAAAPALPLLGTREPETVLLLAAAAIVVVTALRALASYASTVSFALIGNRVVAEIRRDLYRHLQRLPLTFHTSARGGDLTMRVIADTGMLRDVAVTALLPMLGNVLVLAGMLAFMLWLHWQLALVALAVTPVFWLRTVSLSRRITRASRDQRRREGKLASTTAESMTAIKVVQALGLEEIFAGDFSRQNRGSLRDGVRATRLAAQLERTVDLLVALATALVVWYGARLALRGAITPGELLVFLAYLKNAYKPVRDFAKYTGRLAKGTAAGERVLDLLHQPLPIRDLPGSVPAPAFAGHLRFEGVSFGYLPDQPVLDTVTLDVRPGQRVALVGPSGGGKSTIASLLLRLYEPDSGRILIDGRDIREYTLASLRAQVGVVLQDTLLFAASVRDNIAYGASDVSDVEVVAAARLARAHEFIMALPDGYDTVLGERGVTLSGGQRQRIAIARASVRRCPILLLDEPTTGLDEENRQAVDEALAALSATATTFHISHDLAPVAGADLILFIEDGRVVEQGSHAELLALHGRYATLFRLQTGRRRHEPQEAARHALAG